MNWCLSYKKIFSPYRNLPKGIYILFSARIISALGSFILPLLTLILTQKLGFSAAKAGGWSAFMTLTQAPSVILGGKLADRIERKKVIIFCQSAGALFYILCALFPGKSLMIVFIILAADFNMAAFPAHEALTADLSTSETRTASFSLTYLGVNIGLAISPIFAGLLFRDYLHVMFLLDAVTTVLAVSFIALFIPKGKGTESNRSVEPSVSVKAPNFFHMLRLLPVLLLVILLNFTYEFTYSQWGFLLPLQMGIYYGDEGALHFSALTALNAVVVVLFTPILTRMTHRKHPLRIIAFGGVVFSVSYVMFAFGHSMPFFLLAGFIFTLGEILVSIHLQPYLANHTPRQYLGRINSLSMIVQGSGRALGPLAAGKMVAPIGYVSTWLFQSAFILLGAAGTLILDRKDKQSVADGADHAAAEMLK